MSICPTIGGDCPNQRPRCEARCAEADHRPRPIDLIADRVRPLLHFVGFKEFDQRYRCAVCVFGPPAFVHRCWDARAQREIVPGWDTVVFADAVDGDEPSPNSFDDSNDDDDPAARERLTAARRRRVRRLPQLTCRLY